MENFSRNIKTRVFAYYLRNSRKTIKLESKENHFTTDHLSNVDLSLHPKRTWFLSEPFYLVHRGIRIDIPKGFCVCFDREMNFVSRFLLSDKFIRPILILVWLRDMLKYDAYHINKVMDSVLIDEGFGKISRILILMTLRLT
jgi:hypothetical protein